MKKPTPRSLPRPAAEEHSAPFSPALIGLCGIVIGMCFFALAFAFMNEFSPRRVTVGSAAMNNIVANTQQ